MKSILVPIDFSDATTRVVETAAELATASGAQITLLHVAPSEPEFIGYDPGPQSVRDNVAQRLHEEHRKLQEIDAQFKKADLKVTALLVQGYAVEKILAEAARTSADMIVMGSHGHGALHNLLVGSVADGVLRKSACPVLVVPVARA